ncbi:MAG: DUF456 domain-containing protein [Bacteroidetes bacterium]|jgi:uncharacterized protein|nr:DUF456 domain-containing protein [Bacteroidota bacterium]
MDVVLIILGIVFLLLGVVGCIAPIIPGPPIAFLSLLGLLFHSSEDVIPETSMLIWLGVIVIAVTVLDYFLPIWGTKKFGGTDAGKRGSIIGLILAFIFPILGPLTILVGPFAGAIVGELISGQDNQTAFKSGIGSFLGFVGGVVLKLGVVVYVGVKFIGLVW